MKHKLISVALVTILLFMVLGNSIGCGTTPPPTTQYTLTMASTAGGSVVPALGAHTYNGSQVINLTATPNGGYRFVDWTATAGTLGNATAAQTTFTMPSQNATVTAHFALGVLIEDVPDANQPPTNTLPTPNPTNFCGPMAVANILEYWDDVANHANAQNVTAGFIPETVAEYLGYFMDTNNVGSPDRGNQAPPDLHAGTYNKDIGPGTMDMVRWDATHPPTPPIPVTAPPYLLPTGKLGYNWIVGSYCDINATIFLNSYMNDIDNGLPTVVVFDFWNPIFKMNVTDPQSGETISVHDWGDPKWYSSDPVESWMADIGHAVTGVGYVLNWDPDDVGPLPQTDYLIVHDNWASTPENVAIPFAWWVCLYNVNPNA